MTSQTDLNRYLDITKAHRALEAVGNDADTLARLAKACPFEDATDRERPLHDALALHLDAAAAVAVGDAPPVVPTAVDSVYAITLAEALEAVETLAASIARRASAVRIELDNGLITNPRPWSAADINEGRMLTALAGHDDGDDYEWYAFDNMHLLGCVDALNRERLAGTIDADTYDRHMARVAAVAGVVGNEPAGDAERVAKAIEQWKADTEEGADALAVPVLEPFATMRARQTINGAKTYARLAAYASDLTGPAWDEHRRIADKHMALVYKTANRMGVDNHGYGPKSDTAQDLFAMLDEWRTGAYANRVDAARAILGADTPAPDALSDTFEALYYALYDAVDFAVSTGQLVDVWKFATPLPDDQRDNIHIGILLRFEESNTGTGCRLVDGGPFADHTKELRALVDAYPLGKNSNVTHGVNYRALRAVIEDIAMGGMTAGADTKLIRAWGSVVDFADAEEITRRQVGALRDLVNAKVAEWCDGDEHRAASLAARLPEWERIRDELNA